MSDQVFEGHPLLDPKALSHLLIAPTGLCWWCQQRPATTGEHKFKRTDLTRLMGDGGLLLWGQGEDIREIRGKSGVNRDRYGVIKFPKSLCEPCNNKASKPFDDAYEIYSKYVSETVLHRMPGVSLRHVYGHSWQASALNLARYYGKHFGCRMAREGLPIPESLRAFLGGETDMTDAQMAVITTDTIRKKYKSGFSISPNFVEVDKGVTRFERYVFAAYVGPIGIRYEWNNGGMEGRSQFFHFPYPVINAFKDETAMFERRVRRPGLIASLLQWAQKPR
ncbi:hypothetical protein ABGB12_27945 [Actinocorallia sp. B10E7]|uniref:hypothetical protein n=1 Tax=Actinocorallia sp. B10E7 TaxID=3153558 RepID=UPI00325CBA9F